MKKIEDRKQWHMGFYGAVELEFRKDKIFLEFQQEYQLSKKPLEIDMLIVRKKEDVELSNEIGKLFRKHNLIEYKSPRDSLGVDQFYKGLAYACLYKSQGKNADEIKADEITLTFVRELKPRKLILWLKENEFTIKIAYPGIYYITGPTPFLIQLIVSNELEMDAHRSLRVLSEELDVECAKAFIKEASTFQNQGDRDNVDAVLQISVKANMNIYDELKEEANMCEALRELMRDEIDKSNEIAKVEGKAEGKLESIRALMNNLNFTAEQAMESIGIPKSEYKIYLDKI